MVFNKIDRKVQLFYHTSCFYPDFCTRVFLDLRRSDLYADVRDLLHNPRNFRIAGSRFLNLFMSTNVITD